jgi:hypothetical protein
MVKFNKLAQLQKYLATVKDPAIECYRLQETMEQEIADLERSLDVLRIGALLSLTPSDISSTSGLANSLLERDLLEMVDDNCQVANFIRMVPSKEHQAAMIRYFSQYPLLIQLLTYLESELRLLGNVSESRNSPVSN